MAGEFDFLASPNFGALGGERLAQEGRLRAAETGKLLGEISMQPVEYQIKQAQSRLYGAQAGLSELELEGEQGMAKDMAKLLPQIAAGTATGYDLSNMYYSHGLIQKGLAARGAQSIIDERQSRIDTDKFRQSVLQNQLDKSNAERVSQIFQGVKTPEAMEQAKQAAVRFIEPEGRADFLNIPFSEDNVKKIVQGSMSESQRLDREFKQVRENRIAKITNARIAVMNNAIERSKSSEDRAERRTAAYEKLAGVKASTVNYPPEQRKDVEAMILRSYPQMRDRKDLLRIHGSEILDLARQRRGLNPGVTPREAAAQAFTEYQKAGNFGKSKLSALGETPDTAAPRPKDNKYNEQTWYRNDRGEVRYYMTVPGTDKKFWSLEELRARISNTPVSGADTEEDALQREALRIALSDEPPEPE